MARPIIDSVTISSGGTSQAISSSTQRVLTIIFKARKGNAGNAYVNDTAAAGATTGFELLAGEAVSIPVSDSVQETGKSHTTLLSDWFVDGTTNDEVDFIALVE